MTISQSLRGGSTTTSQSYWYDSNTYVTDSCSTVTGNVTLDGGVSWQFNGASILRGSNLSSVTVSSGGTLRLYNGSGTGYFGRNANVGGVVTLYSGYTWSGGVSGSYEWSTVPYIPGSCAVPDGGSTTGNTYNTPIALTADVTYSAVSNSNEKTGNGGQGISSHQAQYRNTGTGKSISTASRSSNVVTITSSNHGFSVGNEVQIYGSTHANIDNVRVTVTGVATNTFTYSSSGTAFSTTSSGFSSALAGLYGGWTGSGIGTVTGGSFQKGSLTAARYYQFRVYAVNTNGPGQARESPSVFANPDPPLWGTAKTLNTSIKDGIYYSDYLDISGYTLSGNVVVASGSIPAGLSLQTTQLSADTARVTISGVPTTVQNYTFTLRATNVGGSTTSISYTLSVKSSATVWNSPGKATLENSLRNDSLYTTTSGTSVGLVGDYLYAQGATAFSYSGGQVTGGYFVNGQTTSSIEVFPGVTLSNQTATIGGSSVKIAKLSGTPTKAGEFTINLNVWILNAVNSIQQTVSLNVKPILKRFVVSTINPSESDTTKTTYLVRRDSAYPWGLDVTFLKRYGYESLDINGDPVGTLGWYWVDNPQIP